MANQPNQIGQAFMWVIWIFGLGPLLICGIPVLIYYLATTPWNVLEPHVKGWVIGGALAYWLIWGLNQLGRWSKTPDVKSKPKSTFYTGSDLPPDKVH